MRTRFAFLSMFGLIAIAGPNQASGYSFTTLDPPAADFTIANGIDGGTVAGVYHQAINHGVHEHGCSYDGSTYATLDFPGAIYTEPDGISGGITAGTWNGAAGANRGFIYNGSPFTTLDVPGASA